jgi:hypothetical protein
MLNKHQVGMWKSTIGWHGLRAALATNAGDWLLDRVIDC